MATVMQVEVVSPEKILFSGEATMVLTRTLDGDIAFQANHAPFLGALAENHTKIYLADGARYVTTTNPPTYTRDAFSNTSQGGAGGMSTAFVTGSGNSGPIDLDNTSTAAGGTATGGAAVAGSLFIRRF